jgi:hypothetical protein
LNIESLIRKCVPIPQKTCGITKRLKTPADEVEKYFQSFLLLSIPQNNSKYQDLLIIIKERCIIQARRKDILPSRIRLWLTVVLPHMVDKTTYQHS